jgi:hypothetical protein
VRPSDGGPSVTELLHRWCQWDGCENRVQGERQWLMGGDADDADNYIWIRECADHGRMPDSKVEVIFRLRRRLIVRERTG